MSAPRRGSGCAVRRSGAAGGQRRSRSVRAARAQALSVDVLRMRAAFAVIDANLADAERLARATRALCERLGDPDAANLWIALMLPVRLEQDRADELADAIGARATRSS